MLNNFVLKKYHVNLLYSIYQTFQGIIIKCFKKADENDPLTIRNDRLKISFLL